ITSLPLLQFPAAAFTTSLVIGTSAPRRLRRTVVTSLQLVQFPAAAFTTSSVIPMSSLSCFSRTLITSQLPCLRCDMQTTSTKFVCRVSAESFPLPYLLLFLENEKHRTRTNLQL